MHKDGSSPDTCLDSDRDRFILSKGHACSALYAVFADLGYISKESLLQYGVTDAASGKKLVGFLNSTPTHKY